MKKFENFIILFMFILFLNGCETAKKAFNPERKNSSEEFLVEKKSPLALPPNFDELPTPRNSISKEQNNDEEFEKLILDSKEDLDKATKSSNINLELEELIIKKLNKN